MWSHHLKHKWITRNWKQRTERERPLALLHLPASDNPWVRSADEKNQDGALEHHNGINKNNRINHDDNNITLYIVSTI